jgi:hypothetical protein
LPGAELTQHLRDRLGQAPFDARVATGQPWIPPTPSAPPADRSEPRDEAEAAWPPTTAHQRTQWARAPPDHRHEGAAGSVWLVAEPSFVPTDFDPPTTLVSEHFRLEPLGPQHNAADHAAWTSSIAHVRATPGFPDGNWPPLEGMSLDQNLDDLRRHAADFEARTGFTFTVLDALTGDVIGCVYLYPSPSPDADVSAQSWVRASHAELDGLLADAVAAWLAADWPWERVDRPGR